VSFDAPIRLSFCTTCMGRRHHLAQGYAQTIERALSYEHVEFVLLDYGSRDDLGAWVQRELGHWVNRGLLRYFRTDEPSVFHMAHAKNAAHRLARGEILVNLDADNSFEAGFAEEVLGLFEGEGRVIARFSPFRRGCMGRVALRRADFFALGGYDESLRGWGYEDADLLRRALKLGLHEKHFNPRHALALQHSDEERLRFTPGGNKRQQHRRNQVTSNANLSAGRFVANAGQSWGVVRLVEPESADGGRRVEPPMGAVAG
jgi:hypothetical protein